MNNRYVRTHLHVNETDDQDANLDTNEDDMSEPHQVARSRATTLRKIVAYAERRIVCLYE